MSSVLGLLHIINELGEPSYSLLFPCSRGNRAYINNFNDQIQVTNKTRSRKLLFPGYPSSYGVSKMCGIIHQFSTKGGILYSILDYGRGHSNLGSFQKMLETDQG